METKANWNIRPELKNLSCDAVKDYCVQNSIPASVCMVNVEGDFNISTMVRNANFFGFSSVHYCGKKKWDRRGAVGTHHYTPMFYHKDEVDAYNQFIFSGRTVICVENNIPKFAQKTFTTDYPHLCFNKITNPVFVFGSENQGLGEFFLTNCDRIITIPSYGSVPSLNVGTTSGIIMSLYRTYIEKERRLAEMFPLLENTNE